MRKTQRLCGCSRVYDWRRSCCGWWWCSQRSRCHRPVTITLDFDQWFHPLKKKLAKISLGLAIPQPINVRHNNVNRKHCFTSVSTMGCGRLLTLWYCTYLYIFVFLIILNKFLERKSWSELNSLTFTSDSWWEQQPKTGWMRFVFVVYGN